MYETRTKIMLHTEPSLNTACDPLSSALTPRHDVSARVTGQTEDVCVS